MNSTPDMPLRETVSSPPAEKQPTAVICLADLHGGMDMDAFRLAAALRPRVPVVLVAKEGSPLAERYRDAAAKLDIPIETIRFRTFFSPSLIAGARAVVHRYHIRNVIFFGASELRSLYFSFLGLPINLIVRHGTTKSTPKKDPLHRLIYSGVRWHVAICEHLARNVKQIIPFGRSARLKVIYSALRHMPHDLPPPRIRDGNPVRLLHVGRVAPGKGHIDAIQACSVLHDSGIPFRFDIVGDIFPPFEKRFLSVLNSVPYKDSIHVHGFRNDVPAFLRQADIFFYPSSGEGLSNSFIEALGHGLLCIAYSNTSFPELRELGFDFLIAEHENLDDLRAKLGDALNRLKETAIPMKVNVELAKHVFCPQREIDQFLQLLK